MPGSSVDGVTDRGVGNGSYKIPQGIAGGEYTLVARSLDGFFPEEKRKLQVRVYRTPRFKKKIELDRRSYGPSDKVAATFTAERAEGGAAANAQVRVIAFVDGGAVYQNTAMTDASGKVDIAFSLPPHISIGKSRLAVAIDDGGTQETQSKTIPIQLGIVKAEFFPEGGYLVAGLKNRVYFRARSTLGEPVHIAGEVLSSSGRRVADLSTLRDGMGRFEMTPEEGERYTLKITEPVDITSSPQLPSVVTNLPVIDTASGVFADGEEVALSIRSREERPLLIQAVCRGRLLSNNTVVANAGLTSISIPVPGHIGGVVRVTVSDPETVPARPLVERLVYCRKDSGLDVRLVDAPSELEGSPGDSKRLTLEVTDADGKPTPAMLGVSVVDDAALSLDDQERPTLRTHFMLTSEIDSPEDLEHANFYLAEGEDAEQSLDLLLGTQGWRRFVSGTGDAPNESFREELARLIELDGNTIDPHRSADNQATVNIQWQAYMTLVDRAWRSMWRDLRIMIGPLVLVWLLAFLMRPRQQMATAVALIMLGGFSGVAIIGCGAPAPTEGVAASADRGFGDAPDAAVASEEAEFFYDGRWGGRRRDWTRVWSVGH